MKFFSQAAINEFNMDSCDFTLEDMMEAYIMDNSNILRLSEGVDVNVLMNQVDWRKASDGRKGRIDILACYNDEVLAVVELKRGILTVDDFNQLRGYLVGQQDFLNKVANDIKERTNNVVLSKWMGVLVGSGVDDALLQLIKDIKFDGENLNILILKRYRKDNNYFIFSDVYLVSKKGRDYKKFNVNGNGKYPKNRLVLYLVKRFIDDHNAVTKDSIIKNLFNGIKSSSPILLESGKLSSTKGWYFDEPDWVMLNGVSYTLKFIWTLEDVNIIIPNAKLVGYDVKPVDSVE